MVRLMSDGFDLIDEVRDDAAIEVSVRGQKQRIPKTFLRLLSPLMSSILRTLAPCDTTVIIIPDIDTDTLEDFLHIIENFPQKSFQKVMGVKQVRRLDDIFELLMINTNFFKINMLELAEERSNDVQEEEKTDKTSATEESAFLPDEKSFDPVKQDIEEEFKRADSTATKMYMEDEYYEFDDSRGIETQKTIMKDEQKETEDSEIRLKESTEETLQDIKPRKKYARSKPPKAPSGPYPIEKRERKKAQNRTASFRYREKMKSCIDNVEDEMDGLQERNGALKEQLTEMETEFNYLKKLITEAGLGKYVVSEYLFI